MTGVHLPSTLPKVPSTTTGAGFRTPALRPDGRRHGEEALVLPPNHEHQDIDEFPPKGFPKHLNALTEKGGGKRLDTILGGQTFYRTVHDRQGNGAAEHLANFDAMPPGVRIDNTGKKFIQKIAPPSDEHSEGNFVDQSRKNTTREAVSDRLYRILGVPVPRTQIYSLKTGLPVPHDYQWSPGEGSTRIAEHLGDKSHEAEKGSDDHKEYLARTGKSWKQHKQKYEMVQALLGGGDDHAGNSMYDGIHHHIPWKVDNGSSLSSNAGGRRKKGWEKIDHSALLLPEVYENFRMLSTYHGPNSDAFKNHVHQSYAQLQDIAKIWNRQSGNIEKLFKSEHPEQFEIFKSRAENIVRMLRKIKSPESLHRSFVAHKEHVETNGFAGSMPMKVQEDPRNERGSSLFRSMLMLRAPQAEATHEFDTSEHPTINLENIMKELRKARKYRAPQSGLTQFNDFLTSNEVANNSPVQGSRFDEPMKIPGIKVTRVDGNALPGKKKPKRDRTGGFSDLAASKETVSTRTRKAPQGKFGKFTLHKEDDPEKSIKFHGWFGPAYVAYNKNPETTHAMFGSGIDNTMANYRRGKIRPDTPRDEPSANKMAIQWSSDRMKDPDSHAEIKLAAISPHAHEHVSWLDPKVHQPIFDALKKQGIKSISFSTPVDQNMDVLRWDQFNDSPIGSGNNHIRRETYQTALLQQKLADMFHKQTGGVEHEFDTSEHPITLQHLRDHVGIRRTEKMASKKLLTSRIEKAIASLGKATPRKVTRRAAMIDTGIKIAGGIAAVAGATNQVQQLADKNPDKVKQIGAAANAVKTKPIGELLAPAANWIKDRYNSLTQKAISSAGRKPRKNMLMLTTGKKISNSSNKRSFPNGKKEKMEFTERDKPKSIRTKQNRKGGLATSTSTRAKASARQKSSDKQFADLVRRTNAPKGAK